jgi:hypothetical protein
MAEIKRPNYFTSEFLVEKDFIDEQTYHRDMRYRHNQLLHSWGVVDGLIVSKTGDKQVTISPGIAINKEGKEIILPSDPPPQPLNLTGTGDIYVTIEYQDVKDEADKDTTSGVTDQYRRITERPLVKSTTSPPSNDGTLILLAKVTLANDKIEGNPDNSVRTFASAKIASGKVTIDQLADNSVNAAKIIDGSVGTNELANGAVNVNKLADNSVNAAKIIDGSVGTNELANTAVTVDKLADNSVNAAKIIDGSVGTNELANGAVNVDKLADNSVNAAKIIDGSVGTNELANTAVTVDKLADNSVNAAKIIDGSVGTNELANVAVTIGKLADNSVNAAKIIDGSVGTNELANTAVTLEKLADNSVNAAKIIDGSVGTNELANGAVNAYKLSPLQVQGEGFQRCLYTNSSASSNDLSIAPLAYGIQNSANASTAAVGTTSNFSYAQSFGISNSANASTTASEYSNVYSYGLSSSANASSTASGSQIDSNYYGTYAQSYGVSASATASTTGKLSNAYSFGVSGTASATSTEQYASSYGVYGNTYANQSKARSYAVYGVANANGGQSYSDSPVYGIWGQGYSYANTAAPLNSSIYGVYATTYVNNATEVNSPIYGVYSQASVTATKINSPVYGVFASAYSSQAGSQVYGVFASASNGVPLYVAGKAIITGGVSSGHITDRFINRSGQRLRTGDVVKLKGTPIARFSGENNRIPLPEVILCDQENDSKVIGIVDSEAIPGPEVPDTRIGADDPTFIEDGGDLYVVILGTYAHCKVDATEAPIEVGDLLTSSNNPGHAKKATDPKLGTIIGKALEPLEKGTGYIAVFVNIQ